MAHEWVLASGNAGKLAELQRLLGDLSVALRPQSDFLDTEVEETGLSFVENALLKARHAARAAQRPALADDSGLCVLALNGAPGIYSARYAGADASDADNTSKLLAAMADQVDRRAYFYCALVWVAHADDPTPLIATGRWDGGLLDASRGDGGFGYDPVFQPGGHALSAAELDSSEKARLSHRGRALAKMRQALEERLRA